MSKFVADDMPVGTKFLVSDGTGDIHEFKVLAYSPSKRYAKFQNMYPQPDAGNPVGWTSIENFAFRVVEVIQSIET